MTDGAAGDGPALNGDAALIDQAGAADPLTAGCSSTDLSRDWQRLANGIRTTGVVAAVLFVLFGVGAELQLYGDGSVFAYAVAVEDAWGVHWHNIIGRLTAYLAASRPAEVYVHMTGHAAGGIALYGVLLFSAQAAGLAATWIADRSYDRFVFTAACLSTACICPLVFGFPTEMWFAHALLWPTLAVAHSTLPTWRSQAILQTLMLALVHTHGGGVIFALTILVTTLLRRDGLPAIRTGAAFAVALAIWVALQLAFPPDGQIAPLLASAALNFIDPRTLLKPVMLVLVATIVTYGVACAVAWRKVQAQAALVATALTAAALIAYWLVFDRSVSTEDRYFLRTALFYLPPGLVLAMSFALLQHEGRLRPMLERLPRASVLLEIRALPSILAGALGLVLLVHSVETAKFITGWTEYKTAVRELVVSRSRTANQSLPPFVSARDIPARLEPFAWASTTPHLSVLLAPGFAPARLVIDENSGYEWIPCARARRHADRSAVPATSRKLIEAYACRAP